MELKAVKKGTKCKLYDGTFGRFLSITVSLTSLYVWKMITFRKPRCTKFIPVLIHYFHVLKKGILDMTIYPEGISLLIDFPSCIAFSCGLIGELYLQTGF